MTSNAKTHLAAFADTLDLRGLAELLAPLFLGRLLTHMVRKISSLELERNIALS